MRGGEGLWGEVGVRELENEAGGPWVSAAVRGALTRPRERQLEGTHRPLESAA